jgi:hypothetical protein
MPNKRVCKRCDLKQKMEFNKSYTNPLVDFETWIDVEQ